MFPPPWCIGCFLPLPTALGLDRVLPFCVAGPRSWAGSLSWSVPFATVPLCNKIPCCSVLVTKRRSSWACTGNPKLEQEAIEGTHTQETPAYQRRPNTQHEVQGSNPPIRALYMQLAKIPHTHQTTPRATIAPGADKPARHPPRAQQVPAQRQCAF